MGLSHTPEDIVQNIKSPYKCIAARRLTRRVVKKEKEGETEKDTVAFVPTEEDTGNWADG